MTDKVIKELIEEQIALKAKKANDRLLARANKEARFVHANLPKSVPWVISTYPRDGKLTALDRRAVREYIQQHLNGRKPKD